MKNLQKIQINEANGKVKIGKKWFRTGDNYPPVDYPPIERIKEEAPADATHYHVNTCENFFWGKTSVVTSVIYYK
ncbi:MAG: hypothetical protein WD471_00395 [Candidatus Paceibacterota bacterium]